MTVPVIFRFYVLRGRRIKGLNRRPFMNSWLTFVGLALRGSDRQRFARIQIVRKRLSTVQICLNCKFTTNSREGKLQI